ncbi:restriction endonuclease subunit S [Alistipes senegalensis]|uniref:restriction endonuclease subunit S n=1 Tax=Alistipes senegalensis TaxID=1288121 RepID=UPI00101CCD55|nr:restriction endonuclease subunit S [Alistipes senegalensis]
MKTNEKDTKQEVVPTLRFPKFHGSKGWDLKPLSDYLTEYRQKSDGRSKVHSVSLSKGIVNQIEYLGRSFSADDTSHYKLVKPYDVVYTKSPTGDFPYGIVKQNFNPYNVIVSPLYGVFTPNNQYIGYIIHSIFESAIRLNNYLSTLIQKGAKNTIQISNDTFISKEILLPDNEDEQQKIADCLSSIDALIKATENKIDELKAHKKGLMQQLFPAEGKTVPQYRFPEFQNAGEWKPYRLNDFGSFFRGLTYSTADVSNDNEGIGVLRSTNIQDNRLILDRDLVFVNKTCTAEQRLKKGDVVICMSNGSKTLVGKNAEFDQDISYDLTIGAFCSIFRPKNIFAKYLLQTDSYTKFISLAIGGGNINNLKNSDLENFIQFTPVKPKEQQKIADCLSSIDDLIVSQTKRLEALKIHKKGLMQQLFPNIKDTEA